MDEEYDFGEDEDAQDAIRRLQDFPRAAQEGITLFL